MSFKKVYIESYKFVSFGKYDISYELKRKKVHKSIKFLTFNVDIIKDKKWYYGYINNVRVDVAVLGRSISATTVLEITNAFEYAEKNILKHYPFETATSKINSFIADKKYKINLEHK